MGKSQAQSNGRKEFNFFRHVNWSLAPAGCDEDGVVDFVPAPAPAGGESGEESDIKIEVGVGL